MPTTIFSLPAEVFERILFFVRYIRYKPEHAGDLEEDLFPFFSFGDTQFNKSRVYLGRISRTCKTFREMTMPVLLEYPALQAHGLDGQIKSSLQKGVMSEGGGDLKKLVKLLEARREFGQHVKSVILDIEISNGRQTKKFLKRFFAACPNVRKVITHENLLGYRQDNGLDRESIMSLAQPTKEASNLAGSNQGFSNLNELSLFGITYFYPSLNMSAYSQLTKLAVHLETNTYVSSYLCYFLRVIPRCLQSLTLGRDEDMEDYANVSFFLAMGYSKILPDEPLTDVKPNLKHLHLDVGIDGLGILAGNSSGVEALTKLTGLKSMVYGNPKSLTVQMLDNLSPTVQTLTLAAPWSFFGGETCEDEDSFLKSMTEALTQTRREIKNLHAGCSPKNFERIKSAVPEKFSLHHWINREKKENCELLIVL